MKIIRNIMGSWITFILLSLLTHEAAATQNESIWSRLTGGTGTSMPANAEGKTGTLDKISDGFGTVGDKLGDLASITKENIDTWLKEANILDEKKVTIADTADYYAKVAKDKASVTMDEFYKFLETLSKEKDIKIEELKGKLGSFKKPEESGVWTPWSSATQDESLWSHLTGGTSMSATAEENTGTFDEVFKMFSTLGDKLNDAASITKENIDAWLTEANILDGKKVTIADTASYYAKVAKDKVSVTMNEFNQFLETLSKEKDIKVEELKEKLGSYKKPEKSCARVPYVCAATQGGDGSFWSRLSRSVGLSKAPAVEAKTGTFEELFKAFATLGDKLSDYAQITKENIDTWLTEAEVLDGIKLTIADTANYYAKVAKDKAGVTMDEFNQFLETLSKEKDIKIEELKEKLGSYKKPEEAGFFYGIWHNIRNAPSSLWNRITGKDSCNPSGTMKNSVETLWCRMTGKHSAESPEVIADDAGSLWSRITGRGAEKTSKAQKDVPCNFWNRFTGRTACEVLPESTDDEFSSLWNRFVGRTTSQDSSKSTKDETPNIWNRVTG